MQDLRPLVEQWQTFDSYGRLEGDNLSLGTRVAHRGLLFAEPAQRNECPWADQADYASASAFRITEIPSKTSICIYCELALLGCIADKAFDDPIFSAMHICYKAFEPHMPPLVRRESAR